MSRKVGSSICETVKALKFNEHLKRLGEQREKLKARREKKKDVL